MRTRRKYELQPEAANPEHLDMPTGKPEKYLGMLAAFGKSCSLFSIPDSNGKTIGSGTWKGERAS